VEKVVEDDPRTGMANAQLNSLALVCTDWYILAIGINPNPKSPPMYILSRHGTLLRWRVLTTPHQETMLPPRVVTVNGPNIHSFIAYEVVTPSIPPETNRAKKEKKLLLRFIIMFIKQMILGILGMSTMISGSMI
jgi:hypothetical protein